MRQLFTTKAEIVEWFQKYPKINFSVQENLVVDIMGDICMGAHTIPYFPFQFGIVSGDFDCEDCFLESLLGAPYEVKGNFYVNNNLLHSLEGCTPIVWQSFFCQHNQLISLEGGPQEIYGDYLCAHNKLCSLKGAPNYIAGDFVCSDNVELKDISDFKTKLSADADFIVDKRFGELLSFSHTQSLNEIYIKGSDFNDYLNEQKIKEENQVLNKEIKISSSISVSNLHKI